MGSRMLRTFFLASLVCTSLFVTAAGGCAAADRPWTPPPAKDKAHGLVDEMLGSDIPSELVKPDSFYVTSRSIDMLSHAGELSGSQLELANRIDGLITQHADGLLEAAELVEAERILDSESAFDREQLESLWHFLVSIHL
jgi:hypothetical protein